MPLDPCAEMVYKHRPGKERAHFLRTLQNLGFATETFEQKMDLEQKLHTKCIDVKRLKLLASYSERGLHCISCSI